MEWEDFATVMIRDPANPFCSFQFYGGWVDLHELTWENFCAMYEEMYKIYAADGFSEGDINTLLTTSTGELIPMLNTMREGEERKRLHEQIVLVNVLVALKKRHGILKQMPQHALHDPLSPPPPPPPPLSPAEVEMMLTPQPQVQLMLPPQPQVQLMLPPQPQDSRKSEAYETLNRANDIVCKLVESVRNGRFRHNVQVEEDGKNVLDAIFHAEALLRSVQSWSVKTTQICRDGKQREQSPNQMASYMWKNFQRCVLLNYNFEGFFFLYKASVNWAKSFRGPLDEHPFPFVMFHPITTWNKDQGKPDLEICTGWVSTDSEDRRKYFLTQLEKYNTLVRVVCTKSASNTTAQTLVASQEQGGKAAEDEKRESLRKKFENAGLFSGWKDGRLKMNPKDVERLLSILGDNNGFKFSFTHHVHVPKHGYQEMNPCQRRYFSRPDMPDLAKMRTDRRVLHKELTEIVDNYNKDKGLAEECERMHEFYHKKCYKDDRPLATLKIAQIKPALTTLEEYPYMQAANAKSLNQWHQMQAAGASNLKQLMTILKSGCKTLKEYEDMRAAGDSQMEGGISKKKRGSD